MENKYQSKSVMHERRARPRRKLKLWSKKQSTDKSEQNIKRKNTKRLFNATRSYRKFLEKAGKQDEIEERKK